MSKKRWVRWPIVILGAGILMVCASTAFGGTLSQPTIIAGDTPVLYKNTANKIIIRDAEGKPGARVKLSASGARVRQKSDGFVVVPTGKVARLRPQVIAGGQARPLPTRHVRVFDPPIPTIHVIVNGHELSSPIPISKKSYVLIRLKPDPGFAAQHPEAVDYHIDAIDLLAQRSLGAPTRVASYNAADEDPLQGIRCYLGNKLKNDPPGTKIYFHIKGIYRDSASGRVAVSMPSLYLYPSAVIK